MKASARNAFLRECAEGQELYEDQRRDQAYNQELQRVAHKILAHFNLEQQVDRFLTNADGLALLANCCNCAAKRYDYAFYEYKPTLIVLACEYSGAICWQEDGVVYIETSVGQVSFHALCGEDEGLPEAQGRTWSHMEYQMCAGAVAKAWLDGMSLTELHRQIALYEQERAEQFACEVANGEAA